MVHKYLKPDNSLPKIKMQGGSLVIKIPPIIRRQLNIKIDEKYNFDMSELLSSKDGALCVKLYRKEEED